MKYIILNFSKWKSINEAESPGKTKQTLGVGQRVVGIPVDEKSFKIKIIRDYDVIDDATKKIKLDAWNSILQWIKSQPKWLPYYPGLNDLKTNFIIYVVNTDTDRKQLLTFTIEPRTSAPGLPETVQIVGKDELATLIKDVTKANLLSQEATKAAATKVMINECSCGCNGNSNTCMEKNNDSESSAYMFFNNLKTIKRAIDALLQMDESQVDELLRNGHDWASDHIATSKDDVTEVAEFFMNAVHSTKRMEENPAFIETFESFINRIN